MKLNRYSLLPLAALALGCAEDVDSQDIRTHGMYADYEVVTHGKGDTDITAILRVGGDNGTFVRLTGPDALSASTEDDDVALQHHGQGDRHEYRGTIDGDEEGLQIQIAFSRGSGDDDALDSYASLPAPFNADLEDPNEDVIQRGTDVSIVWDDEQDGDNMNWSVEGDCIKSAKGKTNDDGSLSINSDDIEVWESDKGESCEVTVTLDRVNKGTVDSAFSEGGEYHAVQRRTVVFKSSPADDETME